MTKIHETSIVSPQAEIAEDVEIGPFSMIGPNVKIDSGCNIIGQSNIQGYTNIGKRNIIYNNTSIGTYPQDHDFQNKISYLTIGDDNVFREGFTANVGTKEETETVIGNNNYFMINSHVAHNCKVGDNIIVANCTGFSGYAEIGSNCVFSGLCGIHQFVKVGRFVMMSGGSVTSLNIPPFVIADGRNGAIKALNSVGLKRNGFSQESIKAIRKVFTIFFRSGLSVSNALSRIKNEVEMLPEVSEFVEFVETSKRGIASGRNTGRRA